MSRRTHACRTCTGRTRHADHRCSRCRRGSGRLMGKTSLRWVTPKDPAAPTRDEIEGGIDLTGYLA